MRSGLNQSTGSSCSVNINCCLCVQVRAVPSASQLLQVAAGQPDDGTELLRHFSGFWYEQLVGEQNVCITGRLRSEQNICVTGGWRSEQNVYVTGVLRSEQNVCMTRGCRMYDRGMMVWAECAMTGGWWSEQSVYDRAEGLSRMCMTGWWMSDSEQNVCMTGGWRSEQNVCITVWQVGEGLSRMCVWQGDDGLSRMCVWQVGEGLSRLPFDFTKYW